MAEKRQKILNMGMEILFAITFVAGQAASLVFGNGHWSFLDVFAGVAGIVFLIRYFRRRTWMRHGMLLRAIAGFILVSACTVIGQAIASHTQINLLDAMYLARWTAYAGIYGYILTDGKRTNWRLVLYVVGVTLALVGLAQLLWYPDLRNLVYLGWDPHYRRVFATLFDPNFAGMVYVLTFLTGLSLLNQPTNRIFLILGQTATFVALLLTYSRSSFLAFLAGLAVWAVGRRQFTGVGIVFVILVILLNGSGEGQTLLRSTSAVARLGSAAVGWNRLVRSPIIGTGFVPKVTTDPSATPNRAGNVDTSFLFVLASTGLLGLISYLVLCKSVLSMGIAVLRKRISDPLLLSSIVAVFTHSLFINSLFYPWVMAWMWILVGVTEKELTADR